MVICHFFLRKIKRTNYLMCETTCSGTSTSPWKTPEVMFEVQDDETALDWYPRVRDRVLAAHPGHGEGDKAFPKTPKNPRVFDIVLKKPEPHGVFGKLRKAFS